MITYELITPKSALADLLWAYLYRRPSSGHSALCRPTAGSPRWTTGVWSEW
jgi:hypothetical protein